MARTEFKSSPGCYLALEQHLRKIWVVHQQKWYMVPRSQFPETLCPIWPMGTPMLTCTFACYGTGFTLLPQSLHHITVWSLPCHSQPARGTCYVLLFVRIHTIHPSNDLMKAHTMASSLALKPSHSILVARVKPSLLTWTL